MDTLRIGLMGYGRWAREAYTPVLLEREDVRVVAVSARSDETLAAARASFGSEIATHRDFAGLADDPNVDAVMIAVPNRLHLPALEAAMRAGQHVFAEPPLGFDAYEIARAFELAEGARGIVHTDLELRCVPVLGAVREALAAGILGAPLMATVRLWASWGYGGGEWWAEAEEQSFWLWLGCWYLDVLDALYGAAPTHASVIGGRAMNGTLMDHGWASLRYPGGIGQFEFSLIAPEEQVITLRVTGPEGELEADLWSGRYRRRRRGQEWESGARPPSEPVHGFAGIRESIASFLAAVRGAADPRENLTISRRVHQAALACAESERTEETCRVRYL